MNLENYLMPVISTVNDLASSEGDVDHPNGSLLCEKFNSLITEINPFFSRQLDYSVEGTFKSSYEFSQGFFIPQNTLISIKFPDNSRIVDYTMVLVLLDTTFPKAVARFDECMIFGNPNFSPMEDSASVQTFGTFNAENITFGWYAGALNFPHVPADNNTRRINRVVCNGGNGENLGFVIDNCYPVPVTGFIKFTSISA